MSPLNAFNFDNVYAGLGPAYGSEVAPSPLLNPRLLHANTALAARLGLDAEALACDEFAEWLGGGITLPGSRPLAMAYAGHQFGSYVPQLGDGRAILLGQLRDAAGQLQDLHLKGAGPTPYSRFADGRAVLRSSIREYLCSVAMHALEIPTTEALALVVSDTPVQRETVEQAASLLRVARSHIRIGHFEYFYYRGEHQQLGPLVAHVMQHYLPELPATAEALLRYAVQANAELVAAWQVYGFAHGVMNTDNTSVLGLTLDYGPFGWLEAYEPGFICNHSDHSGRYAFERQPQVMHWNLHCLAQALLPELAEEEEAAIALARDCLACFEDSYQAHWLVLMRGRLGLDEAVDDAELIAGLLALLQSAGADYQRSLRRLAEQGVDGLRKFLHKASAVDVEAWCQRYVARHPVQDAARLQRNPCYVLRNWLAQQAISAAEEGDFSAVAQLFEALSAPAQRADRFAALDADAPAWAAGLAVSCSS